MQLTRSYHVGVSRSPARVRGSQKDPAYLIAVFSMMFCSCSLLVDSDAVQCSIDKDCTMRGGEFASSECVNHFCQPKTSWSCLGDIRWEPPTSTSSVGVVVNLIDIITQLPMPDISLKACHKLDTECASPVFTDLVSDSSGRLSFTIQAGFDGYLESTSSGVMPFIYFFYPPLGTNGEASREVPGVPILKEAALAEFAKLAGASVLPDRGHVLARAYSCVPGETAVGLHFSSQEGDDATTPFYMIKGIPSTKHSATDGSGSGGLLNLPPGTATLTGSFDNDEAMGTISVLAKRGRITYTTLLPAPR